MFPSGGGAHTRPNDLFAGRYAVDGALPWGGLVTYYRAAAEGTPLILCVLPMDVSGSHRAARSFGELAQRLGAAESASIPRVLDAGVIDGVPYFAFEDTRGTLLADILHDRELSSLEVLKLAGDVLDALQAAHAQGLAHGDLAPQNIVVTRDRRGRLTAKVIGLGVLPLLRGNPEASAHASHTGSGKHAVSYMAPELFGGGGFQPAADLYSMGALLHHMVTGAPPVGWESGEGFDDMPSLPDVIRRAMAKRPANRYPSAGSMRTALEWIDVESSSAGRPPAHASSIHPTGKVLSTSGARPIPVAPVVIEELDTRNRQWLQIALLLLLLGTLAFSGFWYRAQMNATEPTVPLGLEAETSDAR